MQITGSNGGSIRVAAIAHAATQWTNMTDIFFDHGRKQEDPDKNQCRHRENMPTSHRKAPDWALNPTPSCTFYFKECARSQT